MSYINNDKNEVKKFSIYVDIREPRQIYERLEQFKEFEVIRQKLDVGDYFIPADKSLLIERKTVMDYLNSVFDTRLWDELARMKESKLSDEGKLIPILLIEGNWNFVLKFGKKEDKHVIGTIYASLLSTIASFGVNVISSPSIMWTPYIIASMVKWLGKPKSINPPIYKPKALTLDEVAIRVLSSFPHISVERAKKILKHYGTLKNALDNVGWWKHSIDGIGDKIVSDVKAVLEHKIKIVEKK
jgi:ERCC4-type nuclease